MTGGPGGDGTQSSRTLRAVAELAALVRESVAANAVREVLHLHVAPLGPAMRRPQHQRLLRTAMEPALAAARTRVFELPNGDIVAVAPPPALALQAARQELARLLDGAAEVAVRVMRLPEEAAQLLAAAAESIGLETASPEAPPAATLPGMTTGDLAALERSLAQADLDPVTLTQGVCRLDPDGAAVDLVWEDRRIAWPALADLVLRGVDIGMHAALQRRLARLAEQRMLAELSRPAAQAGWRPTGLPLSPGTLTAPGFARFDEALPAGRRREITIAFRTADLLADPAGFTAARDLARGRGYRLALDDAPAESLSLLPPPLLGLEVIRLRWAPNLPMVVPSALAALLPEAAERLVLVGVDRPAAIAWGWEVGIRQFQGPLVERRRRGN
jgi:hypothetical protein